MYIFRLYKSNEFDKYSLLLIRVGVKNNIKKYLKGKIAIGSEEKKEQGG